MTLQAVLKVGRPIVYGLGFYQSFRYSRSLAVGWKEQRALCTFDHIGNLAMCVITGYANMQALRGTKFANRIWRLSYLNYVTVPLLHYITKREEAKALREYDFQKLSEEYRSDGEGDARSLGQRIQDCWFVDGVFRGYADKFAKAYEGDERSYEERIKAYLDGLGEYSSELYEFMGRFSCWDDREKLASLIAKDETGGSGRLAALVKKFPKIGEEDQRSLGERIDSALQDHEVSNVEKKMKAVFDFTYVHITDFILIVSMVHTVAAIYIGFNRASNCAMLAFYGWAVAEQGMFWTKPEEDRGPLMSLMDGEIVRGYDPYVSKLMSYIGLPFMFFYKGILGKLITLVSLLVRFAPQSWKSALIPNAIKEIYAKIKEDIKTQGGEHLLQIVSTPPVGEKERITGEYAIPFNDLHRLDGIDEIDFDLFPNQTLAQLKAKLVETLQLKEGDQELQVLNAMETYAEVEKDDKARVRVKNILGMFLEEGDSCRDKIRGQYQAFCLLQDFSNIGYREQALKDTRTQPVWQYRWAVQAYQALLKPQLGGYAVTQKMFDVFVIEDQFKDRTLSDLEQELQGKLRESIDQEDSYMQEKNWQDLTNQEMLESLIGTGGAKGYLHQHVVASRGLQEMKEKEIFLKNIFGAVLKDWENRRTLLVDRHGDFLCRTATATTLQQLAYEVYPDVIVKDGAAAGDIAPCRNRLDTGICLVLQQRRNRMFSSSTQSGAYELLKHQDEIERQMKQERDKLFDQVRDDEEGENRFGNAKAYGLAGLQLGGVELAKQVAGGIGTSRHVNNLVAVLLAKNLGVSTYDEARKDIEVQMQHYFLDISLVDEIAEYLTPITDLPNRLNFISGSPYGFGDRQQSAVDEIIEAIICRQDSRLRFEDVREYIYTRFEDAALDAAAVQIPSDHLPEDQIEGAYDIYKRQAKAFLQKYLPQVLYDLSFIEKADLPAPPADLFV